MAHFKMIGIQALLFTSMALRASTIAVVDSGNDFNHKDLISHAWVNPLEIPNNDRDEDKNGYPDDVNGWNFAESSNKLIDYSYASSYNDDSKKFFDIQLKAFLGTLSEEDKAWYKLKVKDESFIKNLQIFGNWMHGTHVTGITVRDNEEAKVVGMKLIPTEVKIPGKSLQLDTFNRRSERFFFEGEGLDKFEKGGILDTMVMAALSALAKQQSSVFIEMGAYIANVKADVVNGSFGTPYSAIENLVGMIFKKVLRHEATKEELKKYVDFYFEAQLKETKKFLTSAPRALFVFAAGNEGTNNDEFPTTPANVDEENKLTVAATLENQSLANFSNYGEKNVDVAAPGVGILSTIPMDHTLRVSGTSQAAPYVANVAAQIKDINQALGPIEIKKIIMETVDKKEWLIGKVKSAGVVNKERAMRAATLSLSLSLKESIAEAYRDVLAPVVKELNGGLLYQQLPKELVLPLLNPIIITE